MMIRQNFSLFFHALLCCCRLFKDDLVCISIMLFFFLLLFFSSCHRSTMTTAVCLLYVLGSVEFRENDEWWWWWRARKGKLLSFSWHTGNLMHGEWDERGDKEESSFHFANIYIPLNYSYSTGESLVFTRLLLLLFVFVRFPQERSEALHYLNGHTMIEFNFECYAVINLIAVIVNPSGRLLGGTKCHDEESNYSPKAIHGKFHSEKEGI